MQTGKKGLALLLALLMVFSLLPGSALAAGCLAAKSDAATTYETTQGALLEIPLAGLFSDSEGHALTYTLDNGDYGEHTKIADGKLSFTNQTVGDYSPTVTAKCANGESASVKLTIHVAEASAGDENQYGYNETPAGSVKVYVTISSDGVPLVGNEGTVLSHLEVNVPYFDLEKQGLTDFYRYHTENGSGGYVDAEIVERPTALHLYLYMLGVYYLGYTPDEITNGDVQIVDHDGGAGVFWMNGDQAYEDTSLALNITGSATSLYMQQFWGHDENLMYYRNHVYPLMGPGWGSTADYILLSDGDTIDLAMFSNWEFWTKGSFAAFDADDYIVKPGAELAFSTVKYDTRSVADGGTEEFDPITGLNVAVYNEDWTLVEENLAPTADDGNEYAYTFDKEGVYYLLAVDPNAGTSDSCHAPATAKVIVGNAGGGEEEFDPNTYYEKYDFSSISLDAEGTDYIYNIEESSIYVDCYAGAGDKKLYTVTVPEGTELVYVTYPADFSEEIVNYCAFFSDDGTVDWSLSSSDFNVAENDDGSHTITLPAAYCMENATHIAAENSSYDYFNCFNFVTGDNTRPGAAVKVTGVTLDKTALTVDRRATAQLTAAVTPENAANTKVVWKSSNASVAKVSSKGVVTGVSAGEATITATTADGGFSASCTVTVTDKNKPVQAADGYYEIATGEQLKWFADEVNSDSANAKLNARLTQDVDLSSVCGAGTASWQPIGDYSLSMRYSGIFDGQDHTISGLYINKTFTKGELTNGSNYYTALFGLVSGGTVKNLSVSGSVSVNGRFVAGIAGRVYEGTMENCHNYVTLAGTPTNDDIYGHAGVVANAQSAAITNCSNHADITGLQGYTGGVIASAGGKTVITGCWNEGNVQLRGINNSSNGYFLGAGGIVGKINTGYNNDGVVIQNCYNTGAISCYYKTQAHEQRLGGIAGNTDLKASNTKIINCYNTGAITADEVSLPKAKMGGIIGYAPENTVTVTNSYYLEGTAASAGVETGATAFTAETGLDASLLGDAYVDSCPVPVLAGQTVTDHTAPNAEGKCDTCGKQLVEIAVPTRKANYPAESSDKAQTNKAYLLSDLQGNKVFDPAEGKTLTYENYYYERSTDGGKTWGAKIKFEKALFGATLIQLTETEAGTYTYRFYASHDGVNFSKDTWTLTLTVEDAPKLNFTFNVGQDYTGGYPVIKLYEVETDDEGNEILGAELENVFLYGNFTSELPEGEETYDAAQGKLVNGYQTFYATLAAGRYAYRAFAKNADTGEYDVALGGMTLDLPTDRNVDGGAGGGNTLYLQCNSFYVTSKKTDNTYFAADEYHVEVVCPIMGTTCVMGDPYVKDSYAYYPTVLYAAGNACLYNSYAYPDIDGYVFTQNINQTFPASNAAGSKSLTISTAILLNVTVPADATFGLYFQWNNFNTTEIAPDGDAEIPAAERWTFDDETGTKSTTYTISKGNSNYTWRLSDSTHVTQAGWLASQSKDADMTFSFGENAATNRLSHDFSQLGTQTSKRDEADLQVNLDPSGFEVLGGKTRVRAYRHWQLINSDAGNIMVEPDYHWNRETGDAEIETVNGGNTTANWADITPGTQDSIITVYYDSVDVNPGSYGSHGGLFPATAPQRVGVIVVGGTEVTHGTADADVDFNMAAGVATTRSMDWDYNYDTWYYEASETDPTLDFAVKATGDVTVEYAFVAANGSMQRTITGYTNAAQQENGRYAVPLKELKGLGSGKGGTVIIKMTDSTGVSYRLVRVAQVTIEAENLSNPKEDIMPGDSVKLTFSGMFRGVNKISGIFNPTTFKPTYYAGETKCEGTLGQYQKMDNATVTVTIPTDVEFAEGEDTAEYSFTNGYTFGSMYSAANPFAFLYGMTDVGVGTNFNAVTVTYFMNRYADAVVTVHRKVTYETVFAVADASGNAIDGVTVTLTGPDGKTVEAGENGHYELGYGAYTYELVKSGYVVKRGTLALGSADAEKLVDGILTVAETMEKAGANAWDGTAKTEPQTDADGVYRIGTAAELAWFAANGGNGSAVLTADIELAGYGWTPMKNLYGTFDGNGHTVKNLYINSASYPLGLFGYVKTGASVTKLGVTGDVICSAKSNAQAGGIAGYMETKSSVTQSWSAVNVTTLKHGGGIAGYTSDESSITDCYATGTIRTSSTNECYLGGICGPAFSDSMGAKLTNCYSTATVTGSGGTKSYVGGLTVMTDSYYSVNSYYLSGTVSGAKASGASKLGTALTAEEMKAADFVTRLGESFAADADGINGGYPVLAWQGGAQPVAGDVNGDGIVNADDAKLVYAYATGEGTLTEIQILIADMDSDGKITAKDAAMIFALVTSAAAEVTE